MTPTARIRSRLETGAGGDGRGYRPGGCLHAQIASTASPNTELSSCRTKNQRNCQPPKRNATSSSAGKASVTTVRPCVNASQVTCVTAPVNTAMEASASARPERSRVEGGNRVRQLSGSNATVGGSRTRTNRIQSARLTGQQNTSNPRRLWVSNLSISQGTKYAKSGDML